MSSNPAAGSWGKEALQMGFRKESEERGSVKGHGVPHRASESAQRPPAESPVLLLEVLLGLSKVAWKPPRTPNDQSKSSI